MVQNFHEGVERYKRSDAYTVCKFLADRLRGACLKDFQAYSYFPDRQSLINLPCELCITRVRLLAGRIATREQVRGNPVACVAGVRSTLRLRRRQTGHFRFGSRFHSVRKVQRQELCQLLAWRPFRFVLGIRHDMYVSLWIAHLGLAQGGSVSRLFGFDFSQSLTDLSNAAKGPAAAGLVPPMAMANQGISMGAGLVQARAGIRF